jgi:hypothetical protein
MYHARSGKRAILKAVVGDREAGYIIQRGVLISRIHVFHPKFMYIQFLFTLPMLQEMEVSDNPSLRRDTSDPTLICTAYKKNRFYLFTRKDPDDIKG